MRREILYQYDLPIEILDAIPADEEVLTVLFGRSKEKYLIPVIFSRKRILWGYPEKETVYKVYEQHYIDIETASAKFPPALSASLTLQTNTRTITFPNIQEKAEDVRGALFTIAEQLKKRTGVYWEVLQQKNLLTEEFYLKKNPDIAVAEYTDDDFFEEERRPDPLDLPHEALFTHFPAEEEGDVFEDKTAETEPPTSAMVDRISRMVQATEPIEEPEEESDAESETGAVIYDTPVTSVVKDDQWHDEGGGDAEILPRGRPWKNMPASKAAEQFAPLYSPDDDDSEVYETTSRPKLVVPKPKPAVVPESTAEAKTLHPKEEYDEATIDKSLEALKFLRDNKIISEAEYKKRSLSLFEKED